MLVGLGINSETRFTRAAIAAHLSNRAPELYLLSISSELRPGLDGSIRPAPRTPMVRTL